MAEDMARLRDDNVKLRKELDRAKEESETPKNSRSELRIHE